MISAMITATAIPEGPEIENMFPEAPGILEGIRPAPAVPVWQQAADRIFPPHGATTGALIRAANGSSLKMEATRWAAGRR